MNEFTSQWLIPISTNLIAAAMLYVIGKLFAKMTASKAMVKGVASKATLTIANTAFEAAQYVFLLWFFISQLRSLVDQPGAPTRLDTALIAFWMCWLVLLMLRLLAGRPLMSRTDPG